MVFSREVIAQIDLGLRGGSADGQARGGGGGGGEFSGRDFAGQQVSSPLMRSDIGIKAARAWAWSEGGAANVVGPDGLPVSTQRLYLQGDVRIDMGGYTFSAAQAVVWIQTLGPSGVMSRDTEHRVRQIAVQFDRVADPGAEAGYSQAADRLLVTATLDGVLSLAVDSVSAGRPDGAVQTPFLNEGERRFARFLRELSTGEVESGEIPAAQAPGVISGRIVPGRSRPYEPLSPIARQSGKKFSEGEGLPIEQRVEPLFARDGVVTFAVGTRAASSAAAPEFGETVDNNEYIRLQRGTDDNTLLLTGGVAVQYSDLRRTRNLLITAERAVVFLPPGPLTELTRFGVDQVRGVYLEGDVVATDGQYTLRGPRVYYDFATNKAVMADAVFSTVDAKSGLPIYVRAQTLRQEGANQVVAEKARLSTSSFFTPVFSVGASSVTVTQAPVLAEGGRTVTSVDAKDLTLRLGGLPFFWFPGFEGELADVPLQDVRVENSSGSGSAVKTTWDLFGVIGVKKPEGVNVNALLDYYFDRGFAFGTRSSWEVAKNKGQLFGYALAADDGRDVLTTGVRKEQDEQFRGMIVGENRWEISPNWSLQAEGSYISDETFVDAFFKEVGADGRELTNSILLKYQEDAQQFSVYAKGTFNDFSPNQYIQQSLGATVKKLPEVSYVRLADDVLPGVQPGMLTWSQEYRYSRVGYSFDETTASAFGFNTNFLSQKAFGINANQSLADRLRAGGFSEKEIQRVDTRHELSGVFDVGAFRINPFVVGRFTGYDKKLSKFNTFSPDGDDRYRGYWAAGSRFSTQIVRIDESVESELFDLHRIRHIIEPSATVWHAGSTVRQESLAVYDPNVEDLATGTAVRSGLTNIWQTQRGGPGRWRSVDVFKLQTDLTLSTRDRNQDSPLGRFFDYRPEYSNLGDYFTADAAWQMTDVVGLGFNMIYDFETNQPARTTAGGVIQHNPEFSSFGQVRYLNALDVTYVDFGLNYQLTRVYQVGAQMTYDTDRSEVQNVSGTVRRQLQDGTVGVRMEYNTITEETSFGVIFEPQLASQKRQELSQRLREIGR